MIREKLQSFLRSVLHNVRDADDSVTNTDDVSMASLRRINEDYCDCVEKFIRERKAWKDRFCIEWKEHHSAQIVLERRMDKANRLIVLGFRSIGESMRPWSGSAVLLSTLYERDMMEIESSSPEDIDGIVERNTLIEIVSSYGVFEEEETAPRRVALRHVNGMIFELIRRLESQRDHWRKMHFAQSMMHLEHQSRIITWLHERGSVFHRVVQTINERRKKENLDPIVSLEQFEAEMHPRSKTEDTIKD